MTAKSCFTTTITEERKNSLQDFGDGNDLELNFSFVRQHHCRFALLPCLLVCLLLYAFAVGLRKTANKQQWHNSNNSGLAKYIKICDSEIV